MTGIIIPETMHVDDLPGIWSPVQWPLSEDERAAELEQQAIASLLWTVDVPEAILRLLLEETAIQRAYEPPDGYDPEQQGEWDESLVTFTFRRRMHLESEERTPDSLAVVYKLEGVGYWQIELTPERVVIERI
jgi:hypothetical protein